MKFSLSFLVFGSLLLCQAEHSDCQPEDEECQANPRVPESCTLVYAPLSPDDEASEWGVFTLKDRPSNTPVWNYGDIVIQVPDASNELVKTIRSFAWNGQETGGQYEGFESVHSLIPGIGMMARSNETSNLLPFVPRVDEGGLTRFDSPGAGSISHYHNYTWFFRNSLDVAGELLIESSLQMHSNTQQVDSHRPSLQDLYANGYCLDNICPQKSRIKQAGRGAFATRNMEKGTVIAPVPVLALSRSSLEMPYPESKNVATQQLLRNYCVGNPNSTTLLFPYGPMVTLINHFTETNVKLQWSKHSQKYLRTPLPEEEQLPFLLMELVTTKDVKEGDELYMDYGREWENAWWQHSQAWTKSDMHYSPSYVMDDAIRMLRTQQEQKDHDYPSNVFTSCFYRYSDRDDSEKAQTQSMSADKITSFQWKLTKGLYDLKNLRPCHVLRRAEDKKGRSAYAVRMLNRPGLSEEEVIPKDALHIVTHVPRAAVRFSDKAGTTDQHMINAFRHEIGLGDDIFPLAWMDLVEDDKELAKETAVY